jgi:hypothetical protein
MIRLAGLLVTALLASPLPAAPAPADPGAHPWSFVAADTLEARFTAAPGFTRVAVPEKSFGAFLRTLPLAPAGTKVQDYRGTPLYDDGRHENIGAVVDIDIGARDLQQCADAVLRMHAEWRYGNGERDLGYHAASGQPLVYKKWLGGERMVPEGKAVHLRPVASPRRDEHAAMRAWLDEVFSWANTASLAREGTAVDFADVQPGDFFVMPGSPFGHAVLVLDVAKDATGRAALLLGQSYMPAQSFQVLRPSRDAAWFVVEPGATAVRTPFWAPFPKGTLRRMK